MALVSCTECGKEISDEAPACPHCGKPLQNQVQTQLEASQKQKLQNYTILAMLGAGLAAVGTFLPFVRLPIVGSISLFNQGLSDGLIILVLALGAAGVWHSKRYTSCAVIGFLIAAVVAYDAWSVISRIQQLRAEMSDNPFAAGLANVVNLDIGVGAIAVGSVMIMVAASRAGQLAKKTKRPNY